MIIKYIINLVNFKENIKLQIWKDFTNCKSINCLHRDVSCQMMSPRKFRPILYMIHVWGVFLCYFCFSWVGCTWHDSNYNPTFTYLSGERYRLSRASGYNQFILVEFTGNLNKKSIMLILKRISNCKSEKILPIVNL
jgi:hypothetical protein